VTDVRLHRRWWDGKHLPRVCMRCGALAEGVQFRTFSYNISGAGGLMALATAKQLRLPVTLCHWHRHFFRNVTALCIGTPVAQVLLTLGGGILRDALGVREGQPLVGWAVAVLGAWAVVWLGGLIWCLVLVLTWRSMTIRVTWWVRDYVILSGVSPRFAEALTEGEVEPAEDE
jgi:hypothetical protein